MMLLSNNNFKDIIELTEFMDFSVNILHTTPLLIYIAFHYGLKKPPPKKRPLHPSRTQA